MRINILLHRAPPGQEVPPTPLENALLVPDVWRHLEVFGVLEVGFQNQHLSEPTADDPQTLKNQ